MVATDIEIVGYAFVILLTVLWTVLAVDRKSILWGLLSTLFWWVLAQINVSYMADTVLMPMSWLYYGVGAIFMVYSFVLMILSLMRLAKGKQDDSVGEWM